MNYRRSAPPPPLRFCRAPARCGVGGWALLCLLPAILARAETPPLLTYNTLPLGSAAAPLIMRTFVPDPDLDEAIFVHHGRGKAALKYDVDAGKDTAVTVPPIQGIPAAIAVNHGPALSYVFDTTEGRLLYAWQGGFLDLFPYWGDEQLGNRVEYEYLPRLVGTLFYKAAGGHPIVINGRSASALGRPQFVGYDMVKGQPTFIVRFGDYQVRTTLQPMKETPGLHLEISSEPRAALSYRSEDGRYTIAEAGRPEGTLRVTLTGAMLGTFTGYPRKLDLKSASIAAGEHLARIYGCVGCHSIDGSVGYGPTWQGLSNRERPLVDGSTVRADDAYLRESIENPNAKLAQGFPPHFMPPYLLKELETDSLVLFIKSLPSRE